MATKESFLLEDMSERFGVSEAKVYLGITLGTRVTVFESADLSLVGLP